MSTKYEQTNTSETGVGDLSHPTEMRQDCPSATVVHPVIAALEKADASTVVIDGFLGTSEDGSVRIYRALDTSAYVEIPKEAVIHMQPDRSGEPGMFRAFVRASSELLSVQRYRVRALDWSNVPIATAPKIGPFLQVGGDWDIVQTNGFRVRIKITQYQDRLSAFASHSNGIVQSTEAIGIVNGPNFEMTITWNNGTKGFYTGTLSFGYFTSPPNGFLRGRTKDLNNPGSEADWESEGRLFQVA